MNLLCKTKKVEIRLLLQPCVIVKMETRFVCQRTIPAFVQTDGWEINVKIVSSTLI